MVSVCVSSYLLIPILCFCVVTTMKKIEGTFCGLFFNHYSTCMQSVFPFL